MIEVKNNNIDVILKELREKEFNLKINLSELRLLVSSVRKEISKIKYSNNYSTFARTTLIERYRSLLDRLEENLNYVNDVYNQIYNKKYDEVSL